MGALLNRRRYMGGGAPQPSYDENSYIQDGLIFQLDGIAKGNSADPTTWVDLKGGMVLAQHPDGNPVQSLANGWYFDGGARFYNSTLTAYSQDLTVEACIQSASGSGNGFFHSGGNTSGKPMLYVVGTGLLFLQRGKYAQGNLGTRLKNNVPISISLNQDRCLGNGNTYALSSGTNYYTATGLGTEVGTYNESWMKGTVYAIRLYSRRLTEEEQRHNILVDSKRFNFSLT